MVKSPRAGAAGGGAKNGPRRVRRALSDLLKLAQFCAPAGRAAAHSFWRPPPGRERGGLGYITCGAASDCLCLGLQGTYGGWDCAPHGDSLGLTPPARKAPPLNATAACSCPDRARQINLEIQTLLRSLHFCSFFTLCSCSPPRGSNFIFMLFIEVIVGLFKFRVEAHELSAVLCWIANPQVRA